jgi:recombinational DNA repair protein RecR
MAEFVAPLEELVDRFRRLPGIGGKSAVRLAFAVMELSDEEAEAFAAAMPDNAPNSMDSSAISTSSAPRFAMTSNPHPSLI